MKKSIRISDIIRVVLLLTLMIHFSGFKTTFNTFYQFFKTMNLVSINLYNISILAFLLKYWITFPIVGIILVLIRSPRGKVGHYVGKGLYSTVGHVVELILNKFARVIF